MNTTLPLLVGARPLFVKQGAFVRLSAGRWTIRRERVKTTKLSILHGGPPVPLTEDNTIIELAVPLVVTIVIDDGGNEEYISVFATKDHDKQKS